MDIKKLIADLQVCADDDIICPACERYDKMGIMGGTAECVNKLLLDAAEALEKMQAHNDALECDLTHSKRNGQLSAISALAIKSPTGCHCLSRQRGNNDANL